jgi:hypothetical protein
MTNPNIAALVHPRFHNRESEPYQDKFESHAPSFRRRRREGGPAKRRPGESTANYLTYFEHRLTGRHFLYPFPFFEWYRLIRWN